MSVEFQDYHDFWISDLERLDQFFKDHPRENNQLISKKNTWKRNPLRTSSENPYKYLNFGSWPIAKWKWGIPDSWKALPSTLGTCPRQITIHPSIEWKFDSYFLFANWLSVCLKLEFLLMDLTFDKWILILDTKGFSYQQKQDFISFQKLPATYYILHHKDKTRSKKVAKNQIKALLLYSTIECMCGKQGCLSEEMQFVIWRSCLPYLFKAGGNCDFVADKSLADWCQLRVCRSYHP